MMASGTMQGEEKNTQGDMGREKWRLAFTSYAHPDNSQNKVEKLNISRLWSAFCITANFLDLLPAPNN